MTQKRNHRSAEEKAALLRRHHVDKVPVSTICAENDLQPSVFYNWQRELFARASHVLGGTPRADQPTASRISRGSSRRPRRDWPRRTRSSQRSARSTST